MKYSMFHCYKVKKEYWNYSLQKCGMPKFNIFGITQFIVQPEELKQ